MTALSLLDVTVAIGPRRIVQPVRAALEAGQLVALIGPNGAGKTTLLRAIAGLGPAGGRITIAGTELGAMPVAKRAKRIGYLPQGHQAHWPLPARDIVALGRYPHGGHDPSRLSAVDQAIVDDAMARADCAHLAGQNIQTLSGGERARVMMARALAVQAPILLADEPTAALDARHQLAIMATLKAEAARGALVIAVTHDILLAARFADHVMVMDEGRLVADGAPQEVLTDRLMREVYRVASATVSIDGREVQLPVGMA